MPHLTSPILDSSGQLLCDKRAGRNKLILAYSDLFSRLIANPPAASSVVTDTCRSLRSLKYSGVASVTGD